MTFTAIIAVVILFNTGCSNALQKPVQRIEDTPAGQGIVQLTINSGNNRTLIPGEASYIGVTGTINSGINRTLIPEISFSKYEYTFTKSASSPVSGTIEGGNTESILLDAGVWVVTVTGYIGNTPLLSGSASSITVTGSMQVSVEVVLSLSTMPSGSGTFSYDIIIPVDVDTAALTLTGIADSAVVGGTIDLTSGASGSISSVLAGYYLLKTVFTKDGKRAVKTEVVHIYNGQTTNADYDLSGIGFAFILGAPAEPTLTPGSGSLAVSWSAVSGADAYEVWYGTSNDSSAALQSGGDITAPTTTISPVTDNITYYVWVKAKNTAGSSGFSPPASVTIVSGGYYIEIPDFTEMTKIGNASYSTTHPLNGKYLLTNNITLSNWTPIGTYAAPFTGEFNGNGKTITLQSFNSTLLADYSSSITNPGSYIGIFGYVKGASAVAKAEIKNLKVQSSINATSRKTGGLALGLVAAYAEDATIESITLAGSLYLKSAIDTYLGGVTGYLQKNALVKDCTGSMVITADTGTNGGLASGMYYSFVGGFVGLFKDGGEIENCHNTANVTARPTPSAAQVFVGGIAGGSYYAFTTEYQGKIEGCSSTGNITGICGGYWAWAGGIVGCITGDGVGTFATTTRVVRCWASGTIQVEAQYPYGGGITGYIYYGALVSQCYFTGTILGLVDGNYTGGISGYNSQYAGHISRIEDCWSSGIVIGLHNAGGIVGQNQVVATVKNCYSLAAVSTTGTCEINKETTNPGVGGIAGFNGSSTANFITGCVALNTSIHAAEGTKIHRILGVSTTTAGTPGNNKAYSGLVPTSGGIYTADPGITGLDGEDCDAKPAQTVYEDDLGWDFTNIWAMGPNGYPVLQWQLED
jgi:hypothetical protein